MNLRLLIIFLILAAGIAFVAIRIWGDNDAAVPTEPVITDTLPTSEPPVVEPPPPKEVVETASGEIEIMTTNGTTLTVPDFRELPNTKPQGTGFYNLYAPNGDTGDLDGLRTFGILYAAFDDSFTVALVSRPLSVARLDAEAYLQDLLGITQDELCALNAQVLVPIDIDKRYAHQNVGFSDCPEAQAL